MLSSCCTGRVSVAMTIFLPSSRTAITPRVPYATVASALRHYRSSFPKRTAPEGIGVINPAFVRPPELVSSI